MLLACIYFLGNNFASQRVDHVLPVVCGCFAMGHSMVVFIQYCIVRKLQKASTRIKEKYLVWHLFIFSVLSSAYLSFSYDKEKATGSKLQLTHNDYQVYNDSFI